MSGEINATNVVISHTSSGVIVGQGSASLQFNGALIDISNKSYGDYVTNLDNELATKQIIFTVDLIYNNAPTARQVRADILTGKQDDYTITYTGSGDATDESFQGLFTPNALNDTLGQGAAVSSSVTFSSSDAYTYTPASDI